MRPNSDRFTRFRRVWTESGEQQGGERGSVLTLLRYTLGSSVRNMGKSPAGKQSAPIPPAPEEELVDQGLQFLQVKVAGRLYIGTWLTQHVF